MKLTYKVGVWSCVIDIEAQVMFVKKDGEPMHCMIRPDNDGLYRPQFPCSKGTFIGKLDGSCEWLTYSDMSTATLTAERRIEL